MTIPPDPEIPQIRPRVRSQSHAFGRMSIGEELLSGVYDLLVKAEATKIEITTQEFTLSSPAALAELSPGTDTKILGVSASQPLFSLGESFPGGPLELYMGGNTPPERALFDSVVNLVKSAEPAGALSYAPVRRRHPRVESVRHAKVFLEEVQEIADRMARLQLPMRFITPDFEYNSLEDLLTAKGPGSINSLEITTDDYDLTVSLKHPMSILMTRDDRPELLGVLSQVKEILERTARTHRRKTLLGFTVAVILLAGGSGVGFLISRWTGIILLAVGVWLMFTVPFLLSARARSSVQTVRLQSRSEAPGFLERNRDSLFVAVITALVGVVAGVVATVLVTGVGS